MNHLLNYISINDYENKDKTLSSFFDTSNQPEETYFDHKLIAYDDNSNNGRKEKIRHFGDDDNLQEIILQDSNAKENLSTSIVNSMTFISDEHLIKPNETKSNSLFWNAERFSQKVSNPLTQKKSMASSCSMYQSHLVDVPFSTNALPNIPIEESIPIEFHDYQIVKKVPQEILLERAISNSNTTILSDGSAVKASDSETLTSLFKQVECFHTPLGRKFHSFDLYTSEDCDTDYNADYFSRKCEQEKTKTQLQCSKLHLQKNLYHLNQATNFPAMRIQRVPRKTNDIANEICNLGNVLLKYIMMQNNLVNEKQTWPKSLYPEDEFFSMPNLVGFKHETFEISLKNNSQNALRSLKSSEAFEDKVMHSFDCLKTLSSLTECFRLQSCSPDKRIEANKSESLFMKRIENSSTSLPLSDTILKFSKNRSNNILPLIENKDNYMDAVTFVPDGLSNKPLTIATQEQRDSIKHVSDYNNCMLKESEEDYSSSFEDSSREEGSLIEEDQFYDCLEDISLEKSEKYSEIMSFSTDEDFDAIAIHDAATFPQLHFQEPVIFSYVEEDTHEVDEILIYPKIYVEKISNNCNKNLTREEILPKLLENSKFYDGQPIGIFTHVRYIRKAMQNESPQEEMYEHSIAASTLVGNGEAPMPRCSSHTWKSSKLNKFSVNVGVKKRRNNRKKPTKRNKGKITSHKKFYSKSNRLPRAFRSSNIPQMAKNKSPQQVEEDYFDIPLNNSIKKYYKSTNFQQEHKALTSIPVSSKQNYEMHEAGDQLVKELPSSRKESAIDKFDFPLFQQRPLNNKSREQSELKSEVSKRSSYGTSRIPCCTSRLTGPPKSKAVLQKPSVVRCSSSVDGKSSCGKTTTAEIYRKACGDSTHVTPTILEEANGCSMTVPTIGLQKKYPSRQKLSISLRKNLKVEDIVASDFRSHFCFYAKLGHRLRSGSAISKSNSNYWLKRTEVVVDSRTRQMAEECFSFVAKSKLVLNIFDYVHYLTALSKRTRVCLSDLIRQMKSGDISAQRPKNATFPEVGSAPERIPLPPRSRFTLSTQDNSRPRKTSDS